jgi:hypothetical protein
MMREFDEREVVYRVSQATSNLDAISEKVPEAGLEASKEKIDGRFNQITFMKQLLLGAPQRVGTRRAWDIYTDAREGGSEYIEKLYGNSLKTIPKFTDFDEFKNVHRIALSIIRREEEKAKIPKKRKSAAENEGYSEPVVEPPLEHWRFQRDAVLGSLVEDKWRADSYASLCSQISNVLDLDSSVEGPASDSFKSVLKRATEKYLRNEGRPVLTNELADFSNPYMMKRASMKRLLHEGCVRNKLEESLVPELLEKSIELAKLRSEADMPPEVLEPLQAFRGITDWSFDPEIRMEQKLANLNALMDEILGVNSAVKKTETKLSDGRVTHKFNNHLGFVSSVPTGRRGGWGHGKPDSADKADLKKMRYPTLQRVAHSLPKDPHYRSQAEHAIQVLERSRGWTFSDKTKAVNALKEVLDNLPASKAITGKLDKALPMVRYGRFAPGTLSSSHKFVRRKPSNLMRRNRIRMYFRSITATTPLSRRWADRRTKNQARAKKKEKR